LIEDNDAIIVKNISKRFWIYHKDRNSVYGYLTSIIDKKKFSDELVVLDDISFSVKKASFIVCCGSAIICIHFQSSDLLIENIELKISQ